MATNTCVGLLDAGADGSAGAGRGRGRSLATRARSGSEAASGGASGGGDGSEDGTIGADGSEGEDGSAGPDGTVAATAARPPTRRETEARRTQRRSRKTRGERRPKRGERAEGARGRRAVLLGVEVGLTRNERRAARGCWASRSAAALRAQTAQPHGQEIVANEDGALALGGAGGAWPSAGLARDVRAQAQGFAVDQFDPSERGSDWFSVESLDLRGKLRPAIGIVMDGAYRPLVIDANGKLEESVIRNQIFGNVGAQPRPRGTACGSASTFPSPCSRTATQGVIEGVTYAPPSSPSVGDLRLGTDLRLAGVYGDPFTLAIGARVYVPTGQRDNYTGDGAVRLDGRLEAAGDLGVFTYAARVGAEYRNLDDTLAAARSGRRCSSGRPWAFGVANRALVIGPEVYGATNISSSGAFFATESTPVDGILGAHYTFLRDFRLGGGGGPGLTRGLGSPAARWLVSFEWAPAYEEPPAPSPGRASDTSARPRRGRHGRCTTTRAPTRRACKTDDPKTNGCPSDRDKDGIVDAEDACPDVAGHQDRRPEDERLPVRSGQGRDRRHGRRVPRRPGRQDRRSEDQRLPRSRSGQGRHRERRKTRAPTWPGRRTPTPRRTAARRPISRKARSRFATR